jgi:hypothetical protein
VNPDELDESNLTLIAHVSDEPILVATIIEDDPIVADEIG